MANKYLSQFTAKTTPVLADIVYLGDSAKSFSEVKSTIGQIVTNNKIATMTGTITAGDIPLLGAGSTLTDSGIAVDGSKNITGVNQITVAVDPTVNLQVATKQYADTKLAIAQNLADVNNKTLSFDNISPCTTTGDMIYYNGTQNARFPGASTAGYVISWNGTNPVWAPVPSAGDVIRTITISTVLTSADFGTTILCENGGNITVTLPLGSSGTNKFIYFRINTGQQIFVTINTQGGDSIAGVGTSIKFGLSESAEFMCQGTNTWLMTDFSLAQVNFQASLNGTYSTASATNIIWDTVLAQNNIVYNAGSGIITPIFPGRYETSVQFLAPTNGSSYSQTLALAYPYFGTFFASNNYLSGSSSGNVIQLTNTLFFNGSGSGGHTIVAQYTSTTTLTVGGSSSSNFISVKRISNY